MIVLRTALFGLLALLAVLSPAAAAHHKVYHKKSPLAVATAKARRLAKQALQHQKEHGVLPKQAGAAERMAAAKAAATGEYVVTYSYVDDSCSSGSVVSAEAIATDVCTSAGFGLFTQYQCTDSGVVAGVYIGDCVDAALFVTISIKSKDLSRCWAEVPVETTLPGGDDDYDDDDYDDDDYDDDDGDDDDGDDDDGYFADSYVAVVCSSSIGYDLANGPAVSRYDGAYCNGTHISTEYFKETSCTEMGDVSGSATCGDVLSVKNYASSDCSGEQDLYVQFETNTCISNADDDDDATTTDDSLAGAAKKAGVAKSAKAATKAAAAKAGVRGAVKPAAGNDTTTDDDTVTTDDATATDDGYDDDDFFTVLDFSSIATCDASTLPGDQPADGPNPKITDSAFRTSGAVSVMLALAACVAAMLAM